MKSIAISKFKATCLARIESVRKTGKPLLITKKGVPVAVVCPPPVPKRKKSWLGCMAGTARVTGDIVSPAVDAEDWEVNRP
jgi:prevent-host-death family protein